MTIPADMVAAKLAAAASLEARELAKQISDDRRLVEIMWFIQWRGLQPGGVSKLAEDLLSAFPEKFISREMLKAGAPRNGRYSLEQCVAIWTSDSRRRSAPDSNPGTGGDYLDWVAFNCGQEMRQSRAELLRGLEVFNYAFLKKQCEDEAKSHLASFLRFFCVDKDHLLNSTRYCADPKSLLLEFMERHATDACAKIASTKVVSQVFDALDYAWEEKKLVRVDGNSRFGKTEAVKTYAAMYPGRVRLVTVPPSNSVGDLIIEVSRSVGVNTPYGRCSPHLQSKIEFILRHGSIGFIFDEAHGLFPIRYGPTTVPIRLNWVRAHIKDQGLPCALVTTPQAYDGQSERFKKVAKYNLAQFTGRISLHVSLPDELPQEDLLNVARIHFPEMGGKQLQLIVGAAMYSESYLKAVEDIASRARWVARRRSAAEVSMEDVKAAIGDVVPGAAAVLGAKPPSDLTGGRPHRQMSAQIPRAGRDGIPESDLSVTAAATSKRQVTILAPDSVAG